MSPAMPSFISRRIAVLWTAGVLTACSGPRVVTTPPPAPAPVAVAPAPAKIDLTKPPTLGAPPSLKMPAITTRELANGLKVIVIKA